MRLFTLVFITLSVSVIFLTSCRKTFDSNPALNLEFSTDTLTFDTVFTTLGSTTLFFKAYNRSNSAIRTDVILAGGTASNFRINVDGVAGVKHEGVEIFGKDSAYIFVEVTVDPNGFNTPLIITDSVMFMTNGNTQKVILTAWGQDANYINNQLLCDQTWTNVKPYVIFRTGVVDSGCTLNIDPGTQIYMGGRAQLVVVGTGKIIVNGSKDEPVVFQGVRLEEFYDDLPGQWNGIFILRGSTGNVFNYAVIKNANYGIYLGDQIERFESCNDFATYYSFSNAPSVQINNTIIQNSFVSALTGRLSLINAENCLMYNSGNHLVSLGYGGVYNFNHCTFANYGAIGINHQTPVLFMSNLLSCENTIFPAELVFKAENTIVYGSLEKEIAFDYSDAVPFSAIFDHCLLRTHYESDTLTFVNVKRNEDPQFVKREEFDFNIKDNSPCRDAGKPTGITTDLNGNSRTGTPDIGAFEYSE